MNRFTYLNCKVDSHQIGSNCNNQLRNKSKMAGFTSKKHKTGNEQPFNPIVVSDLANSLVGCGGGDGKRKALGHRREKCLLHECVHTTFCMVHTLFTLNTCSEKSSGTGGSVISLPSANIAVKSSLTISKKVHFASYSHLHLPSFLDSDSP